MCCSCLSSSSTTRCGPLHETQAIVLPMCTQIPRIEQLPRHGMPHCVVATSRIEAKLRGCEQEKQTIHCEQFPSTQRRHVWVAQGKPCPRYLRQVWRGHAVELRAMTSQQGAHRHTVVSNTMGRGKMTCWCLLSNALNLLIDYIMMEAWSL
jgi:hypothetical protein